MMKTAYIENRKLKMAGFALTIFYCLFSLLAVPARAAFEDTGTGAREVALGGAAVVASDDAFSLMVNPAGLAQVRRQEIVGEYSRLYAGLSDGSSLAQTYFGYARPVQWGGTLSAGWKQFGVSNLYSERTLSLGYGEWITSRVAAGLAFKQLHHSFTAPDISVDDSGNATGTRPSFFNRNGTSASAYSADIGFLIKATSRHTVGVSIQDFNEPNMALNPDDHEIVPKTVRLGLAYDAPKNTRLMGGLTRRQNLSNQMENTWTGAGERSFKLSELRSLALRGSLATGAREFRQMTMGAGYRTGALSLDYAFQFNFVGITLGETAGTHRFSMKYGFGPTYEPFARRQDDGRLRRNRKVERKADIEQWLGSSQEKLEADETAHMMEKTPTATPKASHADSRGPGIAVQVPSAASAAQSAPPASVTPADLGMDLSARKAARAALKPISRIGLIKAVSAMVSTKEQYLAVSDIRDLLQGYLKQRKGEISELMSQYERMDQLSQDYDTLSQRGGSIAERTEQNAVSLEFVFPVALGDRAWTLSNPIEAEYHAWVVDAQGAIRQMALVRLDATRRIDFMGQVAQKALQYEQQLTAGTKGGAGTKDTRPESTAGTKNTAGTEDTAETSKQVEKSVVSDKPAFEKVPAASTIPAVKKVPAVPSIPVVRKVPAVPKVPAATSVPAVGVGGVPAVYKVQEGDTLESLAKRFYGDHKKWREIYILNEDRLGRGGLLKVGQLLVMPQPKGKEAK